MSGEDDDSKTLEDVRRQAERMYALYEASRLFAEEEADPERLVKTIARSCSRLVGDFSSVTLLREDNAEWMEQVAVNHPDPELEAAYQQLARATPVRVGVGVMGTIIKDDKATLLPEVDPEAVVARAPEGYRAVARRLNVCSLVGVAMHARGRVIGGISLARSGPGKPYTEADLAFLQDLADRAALAVENARLCQNLERRVADGLARLRAANQDLEAFSYSVAHDLRGPLRGIHGFSEALLEDYADKLDEVGRRHLDRIQAGARRMEALIDDLLDLARVGRAELRRERVDVSQLAREVLERFGDAHPERRVELVVAAGLEAEADPKLLEIALTNLLGNAWKFTGRCVAARIELSVDDTQQPRVYSIRDNGAGFDMTYASKLFGVFQRLHSAAEFEGTGIGLATVERIIRLHGGRIWAEATVDRGAAFHFTLE